MRWKSTCFELVLVGLVVAGPVQAAVPGQSSSAFTRYAELEPAVSFWTDVFSKYTKHQVVFHDPYDLRVVYGVADLSGIIESSLSDARKERAIRDLRSKESARLAAIVKRLAKSSPGSAEEERIAAAIAAGDDLPSNTVLAARIRGQRGLADGLCGAAERAGRYLPHMRRILAENGVPTGLASLPLVESSFRISAHSYAGAVGVWQFTRGTGRRFLHIDHVRDERRDPIMATEAAAKYLRENFERLGTWPLAITAYNHGANGMSYAVRKLDTKNLATIVKHYKSRQFGFASRNFYAEFLAAHDVMNDIEKYCGASSGSATPLERVRIDRYVPIGELARCAETDVRTLMDLNPALQADIASGRLYVPKGYNLNLPTGKEATFTHAYAGLPSSVRFDSQPPYYAKHRVGRGQTLSGIAHQYRTSVSALKYHNGIRDPRHLRYGQVISIPVAGSAAATMARRTTDGGDLSHRVARGQTLSHIATLYRVPTSSLQRYNGIGDPRKLRHGQIVKIPGKRSASATSSGGFRTHRVSKGQTLSHIARIYRTTSKVLQRYNGISDPRQLRYGQVIKVPM